MGFSRSKHVRRFASQVLFFGATMIAALQAFAVNSGVTYQGRILKPDGSPLEGSTVQFRMQIRTPGSENCLLYEEQQSLDMRQSKGLFSLTLNDGTGARLDSSGFSIDRLFANQGTLNFAGGLCAVGNSYSPNQADGRKLIVQFKDETMASWEPMPATNINFVPLALESKQVQGFGADSLVRVQEADGTMGNISPLSNAAYTELLALVGGTSTRYVRNGTNAGARVPTYVGNPASPVAGSIWFDTSSNQLKFRDTSGIQTVGTSGGSVSSITAGTGLATTPAGGITSTGSIAIAVGGVVSTMLADGSVVTAKIADGAVTDVKLANGAVVTAKLADGSVTSAKIDDGTIVGGDLASNIVISTTGGITAGGFTTSGSVTANALTATTVSSGVNVTRQIQLFDPDTGSANKITFNADSSLVADYTLTWPLNDGAPNQYLMTDGSGNLSWTSVNAGTGDFKADGTVPMTGNLRLGGQWLSNDGGNEGIRVDNSGNVGIGTTSPQELLDVNGAIRVGTTTTCGAPNPGTIRYNSGNLEYCNGTAWQVLGVAGAGITALTGDVTASGTGSVAATIANSAVTSAKIADGTIATADVADKAVTFAKIQDIATNKLMGRSTASSGPTEEIAIGTGLSLSGGTLSNTVTDSFAAISCANGELILKVAGTWTCVGATAAGTADTVVRRDSSGNFVAGTATLTSSLILKDGAAGGGVTIATPVGFANYSLTLPSDDGNSGQVLTTNGSGLLSWSTPAVGTGDFKADGSVSMTGNLRLNDNWLSNDGGNEGIRIDNSGKVGVGTATPSGIFDVVGGTASSGAGIGINLTAQHGGASAIGGDVNISAGNGGAGSSDAGKVIISGGSAGGTTGGRLTLGGAAWLGGHTILQSANSDNNGGPANLTLTTGFSANNGSGHVFITTGTGFSGATGSIYIYPGPNGGTAGGNVILGSDNSGTERGKVGIGTLTPKELLDVDGAIRVGTTTTCGAPNPGTIRYNSGNLEYCNGTAWQVLGIAGSNITALTGDVTATGPGSVAATIANDAITNAKMADNAINTAEIVDSAVTSAKIADGTIATADVADKAVTFAKIQDMTTNKLLGRSTASSGPMEEISVGTGLSLSGGTLSSSVTGLPGCADGQLAIYVTSAWTCVDVTSANTASTVVRRDSSGNFVSGTATLTSSLVLKDGAAGGQVSIATPVGFTSYALTLPVDDGTANQVLTTNGSGALSWTTPTTGTGDFKSDGTVSMTGNLKLNNNWLSNDGGNEGIRVDNSGNVGIGTATPSAALDVVTPYTAGRFESTNNGNNVPAEFVATSGGGGFGNIPYIKLLNVNGASGSGMGIMFAGKDSNPQVVQVAGIEGRMTTNAVGNHAGILAFGTTTGGSAVTERMRITETGQVGIGTTAPNSRLHVGPGAGFSSSSSKPGGASIVYSTMASATSGASISQVIGVNDGTRNSRAEFFFTDNATAGSGAWGLWQKYGSGGAQPFVLGVNDSEKMRIDINGNMGIGTSSPGAKVDINSTSLPITNTNGILAVSSNDAVGINKGGTISFGGMSDATNMVSFGIIGGFKENATSGNESGYLSFGTKNNGSTLLERMRIDSTGKIGIGTSAPNAKLEVNGNIALTSGGGQTITTSGTELILQQTGDTLGTTALYLRNRNGTNGALFKNSAIDLVDFAFSTSTGAQNNIRYEHRTSNMLNNGNGTNGEIQLLYGTSGGAGTQFVAFGPTYSIIQSTSVGIGTTTPQTKLAVNGIISSATDNTYSLGTSSYRFTDIYATGSIISTSDGRFKTNIHDSDLGLDFINSLRPVSYNWKEGDKTLHYGVIAQEAESAIRDAKAKAGRADEAVGVIVNHDEKTDRYGVKYTELIAPLIKAVQELYRQLTGHESRLATLESKDASQERAIASLKAQADAKTAKLEAENQKLKQENAAIKAYLCAKDKAAAICK